MRCLVNSVYNSKRKRKITVKETVWIFISGILGADEVNGTGDANFCSVTSETKNRRTVKLKTYFKIFKYIQKHGTVAPSNLENLIALEWFPSLLVCI